MAAKAAKAPKPLETHRWTTPEEYQQQMDLPVHRAQTQVLFSKDGTTPYYETTCGLRLGSEVMRTTDIKAEVTCKKCAAKP